MCSVFSSTNMTLFISSLLVLLHCFVCSIFFSPCAPSDGSLSLSSSCLMNLCSLLFLPLCLPHNTLGKGWSILYITSMTQRGTVTSTKSFTLCTVTWRERPMHACLSFIFKALIKFFHTYTVHETWHETFYSDSFFFFFFVLMFLLIYSSVGCDCCGCVRSVFAPMELQCLLVCSGRPSTSLSLLPETLSKQTSVCTGGAGFKHLKHTHTQAANLPMVHLALWLHRERWIVLEDN